MSSARIPHPSYNAGVDGPGLAGRRCCHGPQLTTQHYLGRLAEAEAGASLDDPAHRLAFFGRARRRYRHVTAGMKCRKGHAVTVGDRNRRWCGVRPLSPGCVDYALIPRPDRGSDEHRSRQGVINAADLASPVTASRS